MKTNNLIIIIAILLSSCESKPRIVKSYFPNGKIKDELESRDEKIDGYHRSYYSNGRLKFEAFYKSDRLMKLENVFDPNGRLLNSGQVINGYGRVTEFDNDGDPISRGLYVSGLREGIWIDLNWKGDTIGKTKYRHGFQCDKLNLYTNMYN